MAMFIIMAKIGGWHEALHDLLLAMAHAIDGLVEATLFPPEDANVMTARTAIGGSWHYKAFEDGLRISSTFLNISP